jgi:hypothetical protein
MHPTQVMPVTVGPGIHNPHWSVPSHPASVEPVLGEEFPALRCNSLAIRHAAFSEIVRNSRI